MNVKNIFFWTIAGILILVNGFFIAISLFEIYQITFTDMGNEYQWGAETSPWYFATKNTYTTYIGVRTIPFLAILFFQINYLIKGFKTKELYSTLAFVFLFVVMLLIANLWTT
jgi:hypothetical protein